MTAAIPSEHRSRPRARRRVVLVAAVAACLALVLSACTPESMAALDKINASRTQSSVRQVQFQMDLWNKAQAWSDRMARENRLYHSNLTDGLGGLPWRKIGENVAVGWNLDSIHAAFMGSTGHRGNILDPAFNYAAVGVTRDASGRYWVTQVFVQM
jgi:uncharacterized protein YkwD